MTVFVIAAFVVLLVAVEGLFMALDAIERRIEGDRRREGS